MSTLPSIEMQSSRASLGDKSLRNITLSNLGPRSLFQ
jgi:hypothetical protein